MASSKISVEVSFTRESLRALERVAEKTCQAHDRLREVTPAPEYEPVEIRVHDGVRTMYVDNTGESRWVLDGAMDETNSLGWRKVWVRKR